MTRGKRRSVLVAVALLAVAAVGVSRLRHHVAEPEPAKGAASEVQERPKAAVSASQALNILWRAAQARAPSSDAADQEMRRREQQVQETARTASELDRLAAAVGLTEQQRGSAGRVVGAIEHARSMVARNQHQDDDERHARVRQLDQQERLALLAVVTAPQQPLLDAYFQKR